MDCNTRCVPVRGTHRIYGRNSNINLRITMAKKPHLSRRYMGWKTKTTNGDLCKYRVYEIMGTGRKGEQRTFVVQSLVLTDEPSGYLFNHTSRILRVFKGKALLLNEEIHIAESWLMIGVAVGKLMENKNNDK